MREHCFKKRGIKIQNFEENYIKSMLLYEHIENIARDKMLKEFLCPLYDKLSEKDKIQFNKDLEKFIGKYSKKIDKILEKRDKKRMKEVEKKLKLSKKSNKNTLKV